MNCHHIEKLLPLYVEDDLSADELRAVASHLEDCQSCAQLSREYRDSQGWLQSYTAPAFDSAFYADLKQNVMREINLPQQRSLFFERFRERWFLNPVLAMAALLVVVGITAALVYWQRGNDNVPQQVKIEEPKVDESTPSDNGTKPLVPTPANSTVVAESNRKWRPAQHTVRKVVEGSLPEVVIEQTEEAVVLGQNEEARNTDIVESPEVEKAYPDMLRIELQTSNPTIRIIWFTPKSTETNTRKIDTE